MSKAVLEMEVTADIDRLLTVLSENVNADPYSPVREYIANAHDATLGIASPQIRVVPEDGVIHIADNGCGMTRKVILDAFTRIAGHYEPTEGARVGRFGLGVLSAFLIADRLIVQTRSSAENHGWRLEWRKGSSRFTLEPIGRGAVGTDVALYLSPANEPLSAEPELRHYVAKTFGLSRVPVHVGARGLVANPRHAWLDELGKTPGRALLDGEEGADLLRQYCYMDLVATYCAQEPDGSRIFLGIPSAEFAPLDEHKVAFFCRGVWICSGATRFFPENLAFVVALVEHPNFSLQIDRQNIAPDAVFGAVRHVMEDHVLTFLELLAAHRPGVADTVMSVHATMLLAHSRKSDRLRRLLRDHYAFSTNVGRKSWQEVVALAATPNDGSAMRVLYVLGAEKIQLYAVDQLAARGRQAVLASGAERMLVEDLARAEGLRVADAMALMNDTNVLIVPDAFKALAAMLAAPVRRHGITSISFVQLAAQVGPALFRIESTHGESAKRSTPTAGSAGQMIRIEGLLLNVAHPLVEKLAGAARRLDPPTLRRVADVLYCVAALNSPFEQAKADVSEQAVALLVEGLGGCLGARGGSKPSAELTGGAKCFVALPYSPEFENVWVGLVNVFGVEPYKWDVVRADQDIREASILTGLLDHIRGSRRLVADISGCNVNVVLELGMMLRQDPHTVLILSDDETFREFPADLRGHMSLVYQKGLRGDVSRFTLWLSERVKCHTEFIAMRGPAPPPSVRGGA